MVVLEQDPLGQGGLSGFARRFRAGEITSEQATRAYLSRIEALDPRLGAFQHVAAEQALETARAIDALYSAGTDLGLLMGVPIAVKDLFVVEGMPTTAGTKMSIDDIAGPEGPLVKSKVYDKQDALSLVRQRPSSSPSALQGYPVPRAHL
jgi:aspartyl-tRNA(Asn)/glutamyl-tRNA(Gln) amidotransferase subunit A